MAAKEKLSRLDKFSLITGVIGLVADTIAIGSFAYSLGLLGLPILGEMTRESKDGNLLLTALIGFYSLTLIVWFLLRLERSRGHSDEADLAAEILDVSEDEVVMLGILFIPLIGPFFLGLVRPTRVIYFFTVFIAVLPTTLWIYTLSSQPWSALGIGLLVSLTVSQYSTFFALVLDRFFR
ncbi:MAG: hypothetical protein ACOYZ6_18715 [Chloroflexota bacterium]